MKRLHDNMGNVLAGRMHRRTFLRASGATGLGASAMLRYLKPTLAAEQPAGSTQAYIKAHPLYFDVWEFDPDIVQKSVSEFNREYQENAILQVLPGDYITAELNKLVARAPITMVYSQSELVKFYKAGFIQILDDLPGLDEIKEATLPVQWEAQTYDGHLLGLPYFNSAKPLVAVNTVLAEKVGFKHQYPKSWPELYAMARKAKQTGALPGPAYLPRWVPTPIEITNMWIAETRNRGSKVFDEKTFAPQFDASSEAAHVLDDWHALYVDGVVPRSAVTNTVNELIDGMSSGQFLYSQQELYDFYRMNDPARSRMAGHIGFAPFAGQAWGYFNYGLYSLITQKHGSAVDHERGLRLIRFFGYQNDKGKFWVQRQWVLRENLGIGYPQVYQDPAIVAFFKTWQPSREVLGYDFQEEAEKIRAKAHKLPIWNSPWYADFNIAAIPILTSVIIGSVSVGEGIKRLRRKAESLIQAYR